MNASRAGRDYQIGTVRAQLLRQFGQRAVDMRTDLLALGFNQPCRDAGDQMLE